MQIPTSFSPKSNAEFSANTRPGIESESPATSEIHAVSARCSVHPSLLAPTRPDNRDL